MLKLNKAFTLIEIMIGIIIVSIVTISGFQIYSNLLIGKVKIIEHSHLNRDSVYFTEKLFQLIKEGGTIDYEEYFNRSVVGRTFYTGNITSSNDGGYFVRQTGFGNFGKSSTPGSNSHVGSTNYGNGFYYCRSRPGVPMGTDGCYRPISGNDFSSRINGNNFGARLGEPQRYGQYRLQFIDYNSNASSNFGDEDGNGNIIGDDDDEFLGIGPSVFVLTHNIKEIYLISGDKTKRTLIRWRVIRDPDAPSGATCNINSSGYILGTSDGCKGNIEFLRLEGRDWGLNHLELNIDSDGTNGDGIIDTWLIDRQFTGGIDVVAGSNNNNYRKPLFSDNIHVSDFRVFIYPNTNPYYSWKVSSHQPYVMINLKLKHSWQIRKKTKSEGKELNFSKTINLTDVYSN